MDIPSELVLISGRGTYPACLAASAREAGVQRVIAIAFRGETSRKLEQVADEVHWIRLGRLQALLDLLSELRISSAVMVGQIKPRHLFNIRMDRAMLDLLKALPERNAHTIFGAIVTRIESMNINLLPAWAFMQSAMPEEGVLCGAQPDSRQEEDIALGLHVAKRTSGLDIGQTVVIKEGTILAVEAFEGTDKAIRRAGKLGGRGSVVVKVAKKDHDMRFDIPVIGMRTVRSMKQAGANLLCMEAGRTLLLERDNVLHAAGRAGITLVARKTEDWNTGPEMENKE